MQDAAAAILDGELDLAVITGAEALDTERQAKKAGERLAWSHRAKPAPPFPFEAPFHPAEVAHEVFQAWLTFPVFDVARRARLGIAPATYRAQIGELLAPFSEVAATNPYAWFPDRAVRRAPVHARRPTNRIVGYPYTKHAVSVMDVDMAAAVDRRQPRQGRRARRAARAPRVPARLVLRHRPRLRGRAPRPVGVARHGRRQSARR